MTTETPTIHSLAAEAYAAFTTKQRGEDTIIVKRADAPEWVGALVRSAHVDFLPDDWRYESIRSALGAIHDDEPEDLDEYAPEWADSNVDVDTMRRLQWLASHLGRMSYCDEAAEEFGGGEGVDRIADLIGYGQYMESCEVFGLVAQSLRDRLDELEG